MPRHQLTLPDLGIEGQTIVVSMWLVQQGSRVAEGEQVVELLAGAVTVDLSTPVDGLLARTLIAEDEPLSTGQPLAVIESG